MSKPTRAKPVRYSPRIADTILERIAGGASLRAVCGEEGMPSFQSWLRWVAEDRDGLRSRYEVAMDMRAQFLADELIEIADAAPAVATGGPGTGEASAKVQAAKLRVDARKWLLARLSPKRYGDRVALEHTGAEGGPIETRGEFRVTPEDEDFLRRKAAVMEQMRTQNQDPDTK